MKNQLTQEELKAFSDMCSKPPRKLLSHRELLEASIISFLFAKDAETIEVIASGIERSERTARKVLVSLCGLGHVVQTGDFGDERYQITKAGVMKAYSAEKALAVAAAAGKGSPARFPASWGQELGD